LLSVPATLSQAPTSTKAHQPSSALPSPPFPPFSAYVRPGLTSSRNQNILQQSALLLPIQKPFQPLVPSSSKRIEQAVAQLAMVSSIWCFLLRLLIPENASAQAQGEEEEGGEEGEQHAALFVFVRVVGVWEKWEGEEGRKEGGSSRGELSALRKLTSFPSSFLLFPSNDQHPHRTNSTPSLLLLPPPTLHSLQKAMSAQNASYGQNGAGGPGGGTHQVVAQPQVYLCAGTFSSLSSSLSVLSVVYPMLRRSLDVLESRMRFS